MPLIKLTVRLSIWALVHKVAISKIYQCIPIHPINYDDIALTYPLKAVPAFWPDPHTFDGFSRIPLYPFCLYQNQVHMVKKIMQQDNCIWFFLEIHVHASNESFADAVLGILLNRLLFYKGIIH